MVERFVDVFGVWEEARPYISLMVDEREMALILQMQGRAVTVDQAARLMDMSGDEAASFLARCYSRGIVSKKVENGVAFYSPTDFYTRLDYFARYDNWDDLPREARQVIDRRYLDEFIARQRPKVEAALDGMSSGRLPNDAVMLLGEVEEMIDAATDIVVLPCDCRRLGQNCERPVETCIRFDQAALDALDQGHGRRLTRNEAKTLVRHADHKGLMHTGDIQWREHGLHDVCNCCACDCYPFRAGIELGSKGVWPQSRYIAVRDSNLCDLCGSCVKRCHFGAFYHPEAEAKVEAKVKRKVEFDPDKCWGCGLCANTCPADAIEMQGRS